jgi:hypothetical protein
MPRFLAIPVLYLEILVDVDIDHRDDDKRQQELDRARVHCEPASIVKNRIFITSSIFPLNSYLLNMELYKIEKGRQRLRKDLVYHSLKVDGNEKLGGNGNKEFYREMTSSNFI